MAMRRALGNRQMMSTFAGSISLENGVADTDECSGHTQLFIAARNSSASFDNDSINFKKFAAASPGDLK